MHSYRGFLFHENFANFRENGFQIYTKRSHRLFLYILRNKYGLKVLKVTEERVRFYRFTGKEPAALRKE